MYVSEANIQNSPIVSVFIYSLCFIDEYMARKTGEKIDICMESSTKRKKSCRNMHFNQGPQIVIVHCRVYQRTYFSAMISFKSQTTRNLCLAFCNHILQSPDQIMRVCMHMQIWNFAGQLFYWTPVHISLTFFCCKNSDQTVRMRMDTLIWNFVGDLFSLTPVRISLQFVFNFATKTLTRLRMHILIWNFSGQAFSWTQAVQMRMHILT